MMARFRSFRRLLPLGAVAVLSLVLSLAAAVASAEEAKPTTLIDALKNGKVALGLRYRFEMVDEDPLTQEAEASTLRTTLSYRTAAWRGFSLMVEAENVVALPDDDSYNNAGAGSLNNLVRDRPVVADPESTEIQQAFLTWQNQKVTFTVGRQAILWGDERFLGPVGWRQNQQSFDAARLSWRLRGNWSLDYAYLTRVHRVFGDQQDMASHWLSLPLSLGEGHFQVTPYGLWLDYDALANAGRSTATLGVEVKGSHEFGPRKLTWEAEAASQSDFGDNPRDLEVPYRFVQGAFGSKALTGRLGFESLGGSREGAFQTPLATLHKWNGWADKFLTTPPNGLEDLFVQIEGATGAWSWLVAWHDFSAEEVSADYGQELDAQVAYKTTWQQTVALKLASYDADTFARDTDKYFLYTTWQF